MEGDIQVVDERGEALQDKRRGNEKIQGSDANRGAITLRSLGGGE